MPGGLCQFAWLTETATVNQTSVALVPNKKCFLLLLLLIAEDVCVWTKTLSPAIWMPLICLSAVASRVISVVSMSTDDSVICWDVWLHSEGTSLGKRQLRSHAEISSLIFRCYVDIVSVSCRLQLRVNVLGHLGKVPMDLLIPWVPFGGKDVSPKRTFEISSW